MIRQTRARHLPGVSRNSIIWGLRLGSSILEAGLLNSRGWAPQFSRLQQKIAKHCRKAAEKLQQHNRSWKAATSTQKQRWARKAASRHQPSWVPQFSRSGGVERASKMHHQNPRFRAGRIREVEIRQWAGEGGRGIGRSYLLSMIY